MDIMQLKVSVLCQSGANLKQNYENQIQAIVKCLLLKDMKVFGTTANVSIISYYYSFTQKGRLRY